jgi:hypothetical protein
MPCRRRSPKTMKPAKTRAVLIADWDALTADGRSVPDHNAFNEMLASLCLGARQVVIVAAHYGADARAWAGDEFKVVEAVNDNALFEQIDVAVYADRALRLFVSVPANARGQFADLICRLKRKGVTVGVVASESVTPAIRKLSSSVNFVPRMPLPPRILAA